MKFIELIQLDGSKIIINAFNIISIKEITMNGKKCSVIEMIDSKLKLAVIDKYEYLKTALKAEVASYV